MPELGKVLFADDDELFRFVASQHLGKAGFTCTLCRSAEEVIRTLQAEHHDVLISDINMPGNENLQMVKQLQELISPVPPVILVTGYPSLETAVPSVSLPVAAYLVKPVNLEELTRVVKALLPRSRMAYSLEETRKHLAEWQTELDQMIAGFGQVAGPNYPLVVDDYIQLATKNIISSLHDIQAITSVAHDGQPVSPICNEINCLRNNQLTGAIKETIRVLQETKSAFKSNELAALRKKLENILQ
jgi:CheY-like chemotaxis protein